MPRNPSRFFLSLTAIALLVAACGADTPRADRASSAAATAAFAEPASGTYVLGTDVTPQGAIVANATGEIFSRGGPVFLSVDVTGATTSQRVGVDWLDSRGRPVLREERLVAEGSRYVAFAAQQTARWQPGLYTALVVIDGRRVSELKFSLV